MPPSIDVYVLSSQRNLVTIDRFLNVYVDRAASEDRSGEELMLVPIIARDSAIGFAAYDWEPALTLSHIVERGLDYPRRAFWVYLKSAVVGIDRAILAFTTDDRLVVGLSIEDEGQHPENEEYAHSLLEKMVDEFDGYLGLIVVENPPPLSERAFMAKEGILIPLYYWQRPTT